MCITVKSGRSYHVVSLDPSEPLVSAAVVANFLNCSTAFVYRHATELGARRIGGLLRFRLSEIDRGTCLPARESQMGENRMAKRFRSPQEQSRSGTGMPPVPYPGWGFLPPDLDPTRDGGS
jgi:hypothetical protein